MRGIILAAGKGSRIEKITDGNPKSFLLLGNKCLIQHQIDTLREHKVSEIVIVTGYKSLLFHKKFSAPDITFVNNPFYARTNILASLWFARNYLMDGFYFMHADTYFEPSIFGDLVDNNEEIVFAVNKKATIPEDMKVRLDGNWVVEVNKAMECNLAHGEFTGLAKISPSVSHQVVEEVKRRIEVEGLHDDFFEAALQKLIDDGMNIYSLDIGKRLSIEIDFPEDYEEAKTEFNKR